MIRIFANVIEGGRLTDPADETLFKTCELMMPTEAFADITESWKENIEKHPS
jgi:hypothetical protein